MTESKRKTDEKNAKDPLAGNTDHTRRYTDTHEERRKTTGPSDPEQKELNDKLDEALEETFPASDPVQLHSKGEPG